MKLGSKDNESGGDFKICPSGVHISRCCSVLDIGTQYNESFDKHQRKVRIAFEVPGETYEYEGKEQPFVVSVEHTWSSHPKGNLRPMLESWRGKEFTELEAVNFEIESLIGVPCMLNVMHRKSADGKRTYANIGSVMPMPKGATCPDAHYPRIYYSLDDPDPDMFDQIPKFIQEKIEKSPEYKEWHSGKGESSEPPDKYPEGYGPEGQPPPAIDSKGNPIEVDDDLPF